MSTHLILASASPRRAELLRAAGIEFEVRAAAVDESVLPGESPDAHVRRLAEAKALAALAAADGRPVLAADTVVVVGETILGKPANEADAARMLRMLSGRTHEVLTGVCLAAGRGSRATEVARTTVEVAPLGEDEIAGYIATGEPADKAGAYAIQGVASRFVTRIDGSYSNVVGLPVALVWRMCREAGLLVS
jgi:septum formation protein